MVTGRPRLYNKVEDLQRDIDKYFEACDKTGKPYTVCGLANALDMDRKTLINYSKQEQFFHTIKRAKQKVQQELEENLYRLGNNSGIIFNLKNNFGWKDNLEVTNETEVNKVRELLNKIEVGAKDE